MSDCNIFSKIVQEYGYDAEIEIEDERITIQGKRQKCLFPVVDEEVITTPPDLDVLLSNIEDNGDSIIAEFELTKDDVSTIHTHYKLLRPETLVFEGKQVSLRGTTDSENSF